MKFLILLKKKIKKNIIKVLFFKYQNMSWEINIGEITNTSINFSEKYMDLIINYAIWLVPKILWAIFVLWVWFKIVNILNRGVKAFMDKANWDEMLESFIISLSSIILKMLVIITAAWVLWVQTSSFVAMLAAAWLAIGMALSWTLQNFAWWVMILLLKPYKIWDYIEIGWFNWTVKEINIFNTILLTPDKKTVIIPNADISNWAMINYSTQPKRRVDLQIGVSYTDNLDLVKKTLEEIAKKDERIIQKDWLTISLVELWDNAVIFNYRFFVKAKDYWNVRWDILENVKNTFDKKWINFPFPQRDIHLYNEK